LPRLEVGTACIPLRLRSRPQRVRASPLPVETVSLSNGPPQGFCPKLPFSPRSAGRHYRRPVPAYAVNCFSRSRPRGIGCARQDRTSRTPPCTAHGAVHPPHKPRVGSWRALGLSNQHRLPYAVPAREAGLTSPPPPPPQLYTTSFSFCFLFAFRLAAISTLLDATGGFLLPGVTQELR